MYDAVIIGGGPAGVSCALELVDSGLKPVILERAGQLGGQLSDIPSPLRNFAGGNYDDGEAMRVKLVDIADRMRLDYRLKHDVSKVDLANKKVIAGGEEFIGKTIVLATGYRVAKLGLADENKFGLDVVYRTGHCLDHVKGNSVAVVGGGDSAVADALELAELCPQVYLIHRAKELRAREDWAQAARNNPRIKLLLDTKVVSLVSDNGSDAVSRSLAGLKIVSGNKESEIAVKRLVIKIGYSANTEPFVGQVKMDQSGHVFIDQFCATSVPGVFAIGDITNPNYPRIAISVGHGVIAAGAVRRHIADSSLRSE